MKADAAARFSQGTAAFDAGDYGAAERIFQGIVEQDPLAHNAWLALAVVALHTAAPDLAVERARRAVELDRKNAAYLNKLGIAYGEQGDLRAAEQAFRRALKIKPAYAEAHHNLAKALHKKGEPAAALKEYERAHALEPQSIPLRSALCGMYRLQGEPERALALLRNANDAELPDALVKHFAECLADVDGPEAAVGWLRGLLARRPDHRDAHHMLALLLLALGEWRAGWEQYAWREQLARPSAVLPARLDGKRLLLRAEQGLGDVLFFLRFAAGLRERGATLALECPVKLAPILANQIAIDDLAAPDLQIFIGDLPGLLQTGDAPPALVLRPEDSVLARAREKLAAFGPPPYLGLTWRAGTDVLHGREVGVNLALLFKEIAPALLGKAIRGWPGTLVSVQRGPTAVELDAIRGAAGAPVHDLSAANEDLREMLALLALLDDYVAVSNTNIHLRAGLGRTARVLVPYPPEWRWMRRGASPWFPGFPVYRQPLSRDWSAPLRQLRQDLEESRRRLPA